MLPASWKFFFFSCFKLICWTENEKYFSLRVLFYMWNFVLVDIVASSLVGVFFFCEWHLVYAWQHLADSFHWILEKSNLQESQISSLLSGTKLHLERKTKSSWQNTMWRSHLVASSGYYRAGTVLIVIWWLRMEGDCCFSYSFLRSLPINDSILVFHLMAFAQICINCKMIFGPTTRGLP